MATPTATLIQNALVAQLAADATISANFLGADAVLMGSGKDFPFATLPKGIRCWLYADQGQEIGVDSTRKDSLYHYIVTIFFKESDDAQVEILKAQYTDWVKKALEADFSLGGVALDLGFGKTQHVADSETANIYISAIPVDVRVIEATG